MTSFETNGYRGKPKPTDGWLRQASDHVARLLSGVHRWGPESYGPGDIAELRRLDPFDPAAPSFWKLLSGLDELIELPSDQERLVEKERCWACFFNTAAILSGLHCRNIPLGHALSEAGFSELRFVRLLRASGDALFAEMRQSSRFLAAKGQPVDIYGFANLLMSDGADHQESVRRNTARSYYKNIKHNSKEN